MGNIGWIDFSPEHKKKVASVINLLKPEGSIDELGIGPIRNALSDMLFPGINTIQTRGKYFLIIPRIFKEYQIKYENKRKKPKLKKYLRKRENAIIRVLAKKYKDEEAQGIIGIRLAGTNDNRELARKPSSIYWNGIRRYGIIRTSLSLSQYITKLVNQPTVADLLTLTDDEKEDDRGDRGARGDRDDWDAGYDDPFGICLPDNNENWDNDLSIDLDYEEACFLKDKIIDQYGDKFIGQVLSNQELIKLFVDIENFSDLFDIFIDKDISEQTKSYLKMASNFDQIIHGAHITYNLLLQDKSGSDENFDELVDEFNNWLSADLIAMVNTFDENSLFELCPTLKADTRKFVRNWISGIREQNSDQYFEDLVTQQEKYNKGKKARLRPGASESLDGWIGINGLNYRFPSARRIVSDIKQGLER